MQETYSLQRMLVSTGSLATAPRPRPNWVGDAVVVAEELSERVWTEIDPALPGSLFARSFACGAMTREDARYLRDATLTAGGDESMRGELEYLAAAEGMAALAARKLAGREYQGSEQAEALRQLQARSEDYVEHRRAYLARCRYAA